MIEITPVAGWRGGECFLLAGEAAAFLVDTGYAFCAKATARNVAEALGGRELAYVLLTHSHYDHVGGLAEIKKAWPSTPVVASRHAAHVFSRQGAREMIRALDADAAQCHGWPEADEAHAPEPAVDIVVGEGDVLERGGTPIVVMETPGHTRCCLNYYFTEEGLLVLSETNGVKFKGAEATAAFMVGYRASLEAIARAEALAPSRALIPHSVEVVGDEVAKFLKDARAAAQEEAEFVISRHRLGKDIDEIVSEYTEKTYTGDRSKYQPRQAFEMNLRVMAVRLIEEIDGEAGMGKNIVAGE
jgi:glyoxylase-like metal-dependent hydrolase (beta-lactamase superfamily II)